mgnify:CR=1 FL=1
MLAAEGAEFGVVNGWERVAYIKPSAEFAETHSFRFTESFDVVGAEIAHIHDAVGMTEVNGFNRIEITGTKIHDWLDYLICGRVPREDDFKPMELGRRRLDDGSL